MPIRAETCRSVCISNKRIEVHLLDVIIVNLMKMHSKHSIKNIQYIFKRNTACPNNSNKVLYYKYKL
jgi:hypothetical protein